VKPAAYTAWENVKEKKMRVNRNGIVLAVVVALLVTVSSNSWPQSQQNTDIFANESDGILTVQNQTGFDIVLFAGSVIRGIVLGGIRANSVRNFDIRKIAGIPVEGAFIIRGVPAESYQRRGGFITEDAVLYSGLVAFDLNDTKSITKIIPNYIDENTSTVIIVSNNSRTACELRLDTPDGPAIAVLSPFQQNKTIWIKPPEFGMPCVIWPIYFSVDSAGTIHESVPSREDMLRRIPQPSGGRIMPLQFYNRAEGDGRINLLFE